MSTKTTHLDWTRVDNDSYGNPRYVLHFLSLLNDEMKTEAKRRTASYGLTKDNRNGSLVNFEYEVALEFAKKFGGRKLHNSQFGGGIVFQCFNPSHKEEELLVALGMTPKQEQALLPEYFQLPFYRRISSEFIGFREQGEDLRGPFVKFTDERGNPGGRKMSKTIVMDNNPGEHLEEYSLRKLREAGYVVHGRCDRKEGYSFLCETTGGSLSNL